MGWALSRCMVECSEVLVKSNVAYFLKNILYIYHDGVQFDIEADEPT